ncbi:MAG: hypothetical protein V3S42_03675, partial [Candidatus Neomarinimicrobiota bacterium]
SLLKLLELDSIVSIESLLDKFQKPLISSSQKESKQLTNIPLKSSGTLLNNDNSTIVSSKPKKVKKEIKVISEPITDSTFKNKISLDSISEKWDELIEKISLERPSIGNVLSHC